MSERSKENRSKQTGEDEEDLLTLTPTLWGDVAASEGVISGESYKPPPQQIDSFVPGAIKGPVRERRR